MALPTGVGIGTAVNGTGDISVAWPTHTTGDVGTLIVQTANQAVAAPSGWTEYPNSPIGQGTAGAAGSVRLSVFYKYATSGAEPNVTVTDPGDHALAFILTNRGTDSFVPYDATAASTSSGTSLSLPAVTVSSANRHIIQIVGTARDASSSTQFSGWTNAGLSSLTERKDTVITTGVGGGIGVATGDRTSSGSIGTTTVTQATTDNVAMFTIALQPPAGINAEPASYVVTSFAAGLIVDYALNAEPASYAVTGFDAGLLYTQLATYSLDAQPASYAVTAFDTTLTYFAGGTFTVYELNAEPARYEIQAYATGPYRDARIDTQISYHPGLPPGDDMMSRYIHAELLKISAAVQRIMAEK